MLTNLVLDNIICKGIVNIINIECQVNLQHVNTIISHTCTLSSLKSREVISNICDQIPSTSFAIAALFTHKQFSSEMVFVVNLSLIEWQDRTSS